MRSRGVRFGLDFGAKAGEMGFVKRQNPAKR
jgi:hypothetical protein